MSDDRDDPDDPTSRPNRVRAAARGAPSTGRALARRRNRPPVARPPAAPPSEPTPIAWTGAVLPAQLLFGSRRTRRRRFLLRLGLFSGLPTLLTLLYMLFVASPRYVSEFEITYQAYQPPQSLSSGLVQSLLGTSQNNSVDFSAILYQYIRSEALLTKLNSKLHLRQYYSSPKVDYLSRMSPKATIATFLRYYLWYVSVAQGQGGYLTVDVQAFDPDYALALAKSIVKACDQMVDQMTARARQDEVRYAEAEVSQAEDRVRKARLALTDFQNAHGDLNPQGSANQLGGIVGTLEGQLAAARAYLAQLTSRGPASPAIAATRSNIAALEGQLKQEQHRLANSSGAQPLFKAARPILGVAARTGIRQDGLSGGAAGALGRAGRCRAQAELSDRFRPTLPAGQAEHRLRTGLYLDRRNDLAGAVCPRQPDNGCTARPNGAIAFDAHSNVPQEEKWQTTYSEFCARQIPILKRR